MSKELLEEIIKQTKPIKLNNGDWLVYRDLRIKSEHFSWLIERARELEGESYVAHLSGLLDRREREIKRFRTAITDALSELKSNNTAYKENVVKTILEKALEGAE